VYRPDIDGIRAIAILSVVCFHVGLPWLSGGFIGVDIFFVISGYLIGGHIYSELLQSRFSFLRFYQRRAKRILPAFYVVLVFCILAALFLLSPAETSGFGHSAFSATLSTSNLYFWRLSDYFNPISELCPLLMTWSLGVEEQFYALIPLLMVLLMRVRRSWILPAALILCVLSFLFACYEVIYHPAMAFFILPTRMWELGAGVILAIVELSGKRISLSDSLTQCVSLTGFILMLAPVFILSAQSPFPGAAALPPVLGTAIVIALPSSWINRRLLSLQPLVFVGRISYSLYLWHWPLLTYLRIVYGDKLPQRIAAIAVAAAFVAAVLSYYCVEQPLRSSKSAPVPLLLRYALVSLLILAGCATLWISHGLQRFPHLDQMENDAALKIKDDPCLVSNNNFPQTPDCFNASDPRPAVALWGDSHASSLAPAFRSLANSQGYAFQQFARMGCAPLTGAANYRPDEPRMTTPQCFSFNSRVLKLIQRDPHVQIVLLVGLWSNSFIQDSENIWMVTDTAHMNQKPSIEQAKAIFRQSLAATVSALTQSGKQVILVEHVPIFDQEQNLKVRTALIPFRHSLAMWMKAPSSRDPGVAPTGRAAACAESNRQIQIAIQPLQGVQLLNLKDKLCSSGDECAYRDGDHILYSDPHHLSTYGSFYALRDFHLPAPAARYY
jgi:peptidoglycan/LPS O-acetylase OafA/YrhL